MNTIDYVEVYLESQNKWVPIQPAIEQGLPYNKVRIYPSINRLLTLLMKLGIKSAVRIAI